LTTLLQASFDVRLARQVVDQAPAACSVAPLQDKSTFTASNNTTVCYTRQASLEKYTQNNVNEEKVKNKHQPAQEFWQYSQSLEAVCNNYQHAV